MLVVGLGFLSVSCTNSGAPEETTPISGEIQVSVDGSFFPLIDAEEKIFENMLPKAKLTIKYVSEVEAIKDLINQKSPIIVLGRQLTAEELVFFKRKSMNPRYTPIATDAIVAIVNKNNPDSTLVFSNLLSVLTGETRTWKLLNASSSLDSIDMVFEHDNSGIVNYVLNMTKKDALPPNAYATKSSEETVNYVTTHPNAIGLIGWSWLSDSDDPLAKRLKREVNIMGLTSASIEGNNMESIGFHKPFQKNLSDGTYPMPREVYIINCEGRTGLGTGFTNFVAGERGQRIMLKAGVLPAFPPPREVEIVEKPLY